MRAETLSSAEAKVLLTLLSSLLGRFAGLVVLAG
jgi:hypothetical protein